MPARGTRSGARRRAVSDPVAAPSDRALLAVAAVAAAAELLWAAGEVAGRLASGTWPRMPASSAPALLIRLVEDPARPWSGWPPPDQGIGTA